MVAREERRMPSDDLLQDGHRSSCLEAGGSRLGSMKVVDAAAGSTHDKIPFQGRVVCLQVPVLAVLTWSMLSCLRYLGVRYCRVQNTEHREISAEG